MSSLRALTAVCLVALLAATATALRDDQASGQGGPSRKLLQPFNLRLKQGGRRSGNVGNMGERRTNALSFANAGNVDTGRLINNTIRARTFSAGETTNLNFGGAGKVTYSAEGNTTQTTSRTSTGVDARSISAPGPGLTAARVIDRSDSLSAERTRAADPPRDRSTLGPYEGPNDDVKAGAWNILGASALDYGFAGDYDYSLITALVDDRSFVAELDTYDYDYGTARAIPGTAAVTTRTQTNLDDAAGRAASFGRMGTASTASNAVARGAVTTSGIYGNNAARFNDDILGTGTVFVPPNQFRQAGAGASGVSIGRSYKGNPIPAAAVNLKNAGTTVSRNYIAGGASDQLNYAHGTKQVAVRSQNVALTGQENIDFDAGRRRLQAARRHHRGQQARRRLQAAAAAGKKQQ